MRLKINRSFPQVSGRLSLATSTCLVEGLLVGSAQSIAEANIGTMGSSPGVVSNVAEPVGVLSAVVSLPE